MSFELRVNLKERQNRRAQFSYKQIEGMFHKDMEKGEFEKNFRVLSELYEEKRQKDAFVSAHTKFAGRCTYTDLLEMLDWEERSFNMSLKNVGLILCELLQSRCRVIRGTIEDVRKVWCGFNTIHCPPSVRQIDVIAILKDCRAEFHVLQANTKIC